MARRDGGGQQGGGVGRRRREAVRAWRWRNSRVMRGGERGVGRLRSGRKARRVSVEIVDSWLRSDGEGRCAGIICGQNIDHEPSDPEADPQSNMDS